jgi:hypothetical protein
MEGTFEVVDLDIKIEIGYCNNDFINGVQSVRINRTYIGKFETETEFFTLINKYLFKTNLTDGKYI